MAKYRVEVGGFASIFRHRVLTIHAANEEEAAEKAKTKFLDLVQSQPGTLCDDANIDSIELVEGK